MSGRNTMASSVTETTLVPYIPEQSLGLQAKPKTTPVKILDELSEILEKWVHAQDGLSQKLVNAGLTILNYASNHLTVPLDMEAAIEKVELIRRVLLYPSSNTLYTDPWLVEGTATWEKSDLDRYRAFAARFANKTVNAEPHKFAIEILNWLKKLPEQNQAPLPLLQGNFSQAATSNTSLVVLPQDIQDYQHYTQYELAIAQAKEIQQGLSRLREGKEMVMYLEKENERSFKQFEKTLQRQEDSYMETTKEQERSLKSLTKQHTETVNLLQQRDVEHRQAITNLSGELRECKTQLTQQQQEIVNLRASLHNSQSQLWQARNDLANADSGGSCSVM